MSRRRTSTGATSIASRTTRGLTSTFMRRSVKTNEFKTHESVSDRESRHFQRGGDFGKKAPPAPSRRLDCGHNIRRLIQHIRVQLLHAYRERTAIFAQARSVAAERRGWCKPGRVRRAPVFLDLSLPTAQEMELARPARQFPALAGFPYHYGHGGAVGNRLALLLQIRGDSRDGFLDYDRGHAQRFVGRYLYAQIPRSLNAAELSAREIKEMEAKLCGDAEERHGQIGAGLAELLALPSSEQVAQTSIVTALWWMIWLDLKRPFQVSRLRLQAEGFGAWIISLFGTLPTRSSRLELAIQMARRQASLSKRVLFLSRTKQVFSLWHVVHRPFSYSFALLAIVHILVVLGMGYR